MNHEEFAFFNQQLAAMLKSGLPLEGSLRQLSGSMRQGSLRQEIDCLHDDLASGTPLAEALERRKLPEFYVAMLRVGIQSNDLPGMLTLLADYYRHTHNSWTRLKGLLVYPAIVLFFSILVSGFLALVYTRLVGEMVTGFSAFSMESVTEENGRTLGVLAQVWLPVVFLVVVFALGVFLANWSPARHWLRWKAPGFRETSLAQLASSVAMMLHSGCSFGEALALLERAEPAPRAKAEFGRWRKRLSEGVVEFAQVAGAGLLPPLFVWLVTSSGENWVHGFRRAADVYRERARYRIELLLYAALPVATIFVAGVIVSEMVPMFQGLGRALGVLGGDVEF